MCGTGGEGPSCIIDGDQDANVGAEKRNNTDHSCWRIGEICLTEIGDFNPTLEWLKMPGANKGALLSRK